MKQINLKKNFLKSKKKNFLIMEKIKKQDYGKNWKKKTNHGNFNFLWNQIKKKSLWKRFKKKVMEKK